MNGQKWRENYRTVMGPKREERAAHFARIDPHSCGLEFGLDRENALSLYESSFDRERHRRETRAMPPPFFPPLKPHSICKVFAAQWKHWIAKGFVYLLIHSREIMCVDAKWIKLRQKIQYGFRFRFRLISKNAWSRRRSAIFKTAGKQKAKWF
jgi:hypothetical protein